ncbi:MULTISPECIES: CDP-diacylglycerol--glycerol-3-phosphate 3-phosphatidyltransferase [Paenibacillus]|uniref:CDP-diacylglycerol--glycerol-3-phosphate 3-phosphatidyltransferase n=1 Tax=Paenibacillus campinasensis TaxID=66347 RepID=A0A268ES00_9BACL|nr:MULTISPECIES: CDP-diacylglycerol--glycerol-3-phosphate 3-phosphatidyltransferase [Paenibacillus]MUG66684.1 CDP-diacylglycerol--glycerol-3-phosphate 3-phosphatidyltransferase [Paenibacillus campinasensis]PAD75907.1 CDP-diacylglycerol--glycerol-3-phosphate 3-phosphatidyltransferase [Paenibacillus campinasensis]PAK54691.1 CDP-diacylglycerol--glycerol-3-phosphate 3-phosphatidyltransferase [Paenibacillus sp. 7541]
MNLPNRITIARICLIPLMMVFLLVDFGFYPAPLVWYNYELPFNQLIAAFIFIVAASTDGIDGYLARKNNMVTNLGKLLDPLADKLLVAAVLISLVAMGKCDAWIAIVIISREFAVTGLRQIALLDGAVMAAGQSGKIKTTIQIVAIVALLINDFPFVFLHIPFGDIAIWAAALITIYSGVEYFVKNRHLLKEA